MINIAKEYLKKYFGYQDFRKGQDLIIESILNKNDTLGIMPTGGGKSICYQIPSLCFNGISIVISPLISLMKDQIDALKKINYPAEMLNSTIPVQEQNYIMNLAENNKIKLLYLTPERFRKKEFLQWIKTLNISMFVVDEAHCISEWGHDFRPEYRKLSNIIKELGSPPILALTATATKEVRDDIVNSLNMKNPNIFVRGFNRENLIYGVKNHYSKEEKNKTLIDFINKVKSPGIIYTSSVKDANDLYQVLKYNTNKKISLYHASLNKIERKKNQDDFLENKIDILVATNAFGMGINKQDIRFVVHYSLPGSIEAYYQETGRAGRDNQISYCLLLEQSEDIEIQNFFIEAKNPSIQDLENVLYNIKKFSKNNNIYIDDYEILSDNLNLNNFKIDAILKQLHFLGMIDYEYIKDEILIIEKKNMKRINEDDKNFIQDIFLINNNENENKIKIETNLILKRLDINDFFLKKELDRLQNKNYIEYKIVKAGRVIKLLKEKFNQKEKDEYNIKVKKKKELDKKKLNSVIEFALLNNVCRRKYLLNYFGEEFNEENCGKCDICRGTYENKNNIDLNNDHKTILLFFYNHNNQIGLTKSIKILKGSYDIEPKYKDWDEYGLLKQIDIRIIKNYLDFLIKKNYLKVNSGKYSTILITKNGINCLK